MSIFISTTGVILFVFLIIFVVLLILVTFAACCVYDFCPGSVFPQYELLGQQTHLDYVHSDFVLVESPEPTRREPSKKHKKSRKPLVKSQSAPGLLNCKEATAENLQKYESDSYFPILKTTDAYTNILRRPRRRNSGINLGLGKVTFSLKYDDDLETLYVYLISGKDICFKNGELVTLPNVKIRIDDRIEDEKESEPDESHYPEFDEEFNFRIPRDTLGKTALNFSVWNTDQRLHKTLVGYVRVPLANFLESLFDPEGSGPISREITESSDTESAVQSNGHVLFPLYVVQKMIS